MTEINPPQPCSYCDNFNSLQDALNLIDRMDETIEATVDGARDMLEEIAAACGIQPSGMSNGQITDLVVAMRHPAVPPDLRWRRVADVLYRALADVVGEGGRLWPREVRLDRLDAVLDAALDAYEALAQENP